MALGVRSRMRLRSFFVVVVFFFIWSVDVEVNISVWVKELELRHGSIQVHRIIILVFCYRGKKETSLPLVFRNLQKYQGIIRFKRNVQYLFINEWISYWIGNLIRNLLWQYLCQSNPFFIEISCVLFNLVRFEIFFYNYTKKNSWICHFSKKKKMQQKKYAISSMNKRKIRLEL